MEIIDMTQYAALEMSIYVNSMTSNQWHQKHILCSSELFFIFIFYPNTI